MSLQPPLEAAPGAAWPAAANLVARWLERRERLDFLLENIPPKTTSLDRARCQHLVFGVVRHYSRIEAALGRLVAHPPRFATRGALFVAGFELLEAQADSIEDGKVAKIVHNAVEHTKRLSSPAEARLVNAVARRLATAFPNSPPAATAPAAELAEFFSHPEWVVTRWKNQFGDEAAAQFLRWNQQPAVMHARWRRPAARPFSYLRPTVLPDFFEVPGGHWQEVVRGLEAGEIYLQDPATRFAAELLAPKVGENVLDLCAAPGGKSVLLADMIEKDGRPGTENGSRAAGGKLVAVDLPGARVDRLKENLSRISGVDVALVQADLLADLAALLRSGHALPASYEAVLLDVPCSNSGVIRHRPDVKWRWQPDDFSKHPRQQLEMLHAAARMVSPGGRLVYSTCSVDAAENEEVVRAFFASRAGSPFQLEKSVTSFPWRDAHDGAGAFLLRRKA